jgi:hypothetical protein
VPTDLATVWAGREVWRSLDTDSYAMALRRIHRIAAEVEAEFEKMRCSIGRVIDPMLLDVPVNDPAVSTPCPPTPPQSQAPSPPSSRRTIGDVYDRCQSASKKAPLSACKRDPFVEQRDEYDGRTVRAGCGVGRA